VSSKLAAIDDNVRRFVRQQPGSQFTDLVGRQVDRARQMSMVVVVRSQRLNQKEMIFLVKLLLQLIPADRWDIAFHGLSILGLLEYKTEAARLGMPYQTLIGSLLHRYVHGELIDRKIIKATKEFKPAAS
jgi:hypothetical protein